MIDTAVSFYHDQELVRMGKPVLEFYNDNYKPSRNDYVMLTSCSRHGYVMVTLLLRNVQRKAYQKALMVFRSKLNNRRGYFVFQH